MKQGTTTSCNNSSKYQQVAKVITNMHQQYHAPSDTRAIKGYMNIANFKLHIWGLFFVVTEYVAFGRNFAFPILGGKGSKTGTYNITN